MLYTFEQLGSNVIILDFQCQSEWTMPLRVFEEKVDGELGFSLGRWRQEGLDKLEVVP